MVTHTNKPIGRHFLLIFTALGMVLGLLIFTAPQATYAYAPILADWWMPNDTVYATALSTDGSTLYIGGIFTYVGPPTGSFAALDAIGVPNMDFPPVDGTIYAIAADGAGGWYIGGSFQRVGGYRRVMLAHILADKTLDFAWNPDSNSTVRALAVSGDTVYVGGYFTTIGGQSRNRIAALNTSDGAATAWNPDADNTVFALVMSGNTLYAGGNFTTIGGAARNRIAALDTGSDTNNATAWDPNANSTVRALAMSGDTIYAGGYFTTIGGQTRTYIAALDANTNNATTWDPNADDRVLALSVSSDTVYAGGVFTTISGQSRNHIAAVNASDGLATTWDPNASGTVHTLVASGDTVYTGGQFSSIGGASRNNIAALNTSDGLATAWDPNTLGLVYTLAVSGGTVYAGGAFFSIGGEARSRIAALDTTTGMLTAWDPDAGAPSGYAPTVRALAVSVDTVYVGGYFTTIGGQSRNNITALNASDGLATAWNPNASNSVHTLAASGTTVYAGGEFTTIGGQTRNRIAALNTSDGLATTWDPNANNFVYTLAVSGNTVYAGGFFTAISGQTRNYIAALNASDGLATAWNPNANNRVRSLRLSDDTVYAGGFFTTIGGGTRNYIAELDATGTATAWDPMANAVVESLLLSGDTVYAGGGFITIGGQLRNRIAALNVSDGLATTWDPNADAPVYTLAVNDNTVYAGGAFTTLGDFAHEQQRYYLATLRDGAENCESAASGGSWQAAAWTNCGNAIPGDGDSITVQATHTIALYSGLALNDLDVAGRLYIPQDVSLSVEGVVTNTGSISQTLTAAAAVSTTFLHLQDADGVVPKYYGVVITPTGDMGNTTVTIRGNQDCTTNASDPLIQRCYNITPASAQTATIRFYYRYDELNGQTPSALKVWHWETGWTQVGDNYTYSTCMTGQQDCWMQAENIGTYSPFVLGSGNVPLAVTLRSLAAHGEIVWGMGFIIVLAAGVVLARHRQSRKRR